jgi:hypothetical protein
VITAYIVTGQWDILLSVRARSHRELQDFVVGILPTAPGFVRSETMVCWEARRRDGSGYFEGRQRDTVAESPAAPEAKAARKAVATGPEPAGKRTERGRRGR